MDQDTNGYLKRFYAIVRPEPKLLPGKAAYFLNTGSKYTLMAFMLMFLTKSGLNSQEAGWIVGTRYGVEVIGALLVNFIADKFQRRRLIVSICIVASTLFIFLMPWVVDIVENSKISKKKEVIFTVLLLLNIHAACFDGGIQTALDVKVFEVSKLISKTAFVKQRIWVSIGFGVLPFVTGCIIDTHDGHAHENKILFYAVLIINVLLFSSCQLLFQNDGNNDVKEEIEEHEKDTNNAQISKVLCQPDVLVVFCIFLFVGLGFIFQYSYVFLLLKSELHASQKSMGLLVSLQACAEIVGAPIGGKISLYFQSDFIPIVFGLFGFGVAFLIYFFVKSLIVMATVNVLVGVSYALFLYPATSLLYKNTTKKCRGTVFAISYGLLSGVGGCLAGFIGGLVYRKYGGRASFLGISGIFFLLSFLLAIYTFSRRIKSKSQKDILKIEVIVTSQ